MNYFRKVATSLLAILLLAGLTTVSVVGEVQKAKNVILMIPDGMSVQHVTATRTLVNGSDGPPLELEKLPEVGYVRTHAKNSTVTDSAAAGSAFATGEKFNNREVSCHSVDGELMNCEEEQETILEIAKREGKSTGLVASSHITHATPATFGAHVPVRYCGAEIARQYVEDTGVDVVLGGGIYGTSDEYNCQQYEDSYKNLQSNEAMAERARENGYVAVNTKSGLEAAVEAETDKLYGTFTGYDEGKTPETFRLNEFGLKDEEGEAFPEYPGEEPTLPEMTRAALDVLEENDEGFFLMVEGSQIDWALHGNDKNYMLGEMLAYNEAVKVVRDWIAEDPLREKQTLLISVGDHDTAGFAIGGPYGERALQGERIEADYTSDAHTGEDVLVWSQGPGSDLLGTAALDNTDVFDVMEEVIR